MFLDVDVKFQVSHSNVDIFTWLKLLLIHPNQKYVHSTASQIRHCACVKIDVEKPNCKSIVNTLVLYFVLITVVFSLVLRLEELTLSKLDREFFCLQYSALSILCHIASQASVLGWLVGSSWYQSYVCCYVCVLRFLYLVTKKFMKVNFKHENRMSLNCGFLMASL